MSKSVTQAKRIQPWDKKGQGNAFCIESIIYVYDRLIGFFNQRRHHYHLYQAHL